jgi:tRNA-dihydrouridine synthase
MDIFKEAVSLSKNSICYNGDIFTAKDYKKFSVDFPSIETLMLGRGLIANPSLICHINNNSITNKQLLKDFHDRLYEDYQGVLSGEHNVLFKMKAIWVYMIHLFSDNEKYAKKFKKAQKLRDYEFVVSNLFREQDILEEYELFF